MTDRRINPTIESLSDQPYTGALAPLIEGARGYLTSRSYDSEERLVLRWCVDELEKRAHVTPGEADYRRYCQQRGPDLDPEGTPASLRVVAGMLATYGPESLPANEHGQAPFARIIMDSACAEITAYLATLPPEAFLPESTNPEDAA